MSTTSEAPLGVVGVVDAVTAQLRGRILSGAIRSGSPITEAAVSQSFGVARPSAKAAIEQLVASGLLVRTAHRSARVVDIDSVTVRDVYRTRTRLESAALRELAASKNVPAAALAANAEIMAMPGGPDPATVAPDLRFHTALIDALDSERTGRMYRSVLDEVRLCMAQVQGRRLLDAADIAAQHADILDAVASGDGERAAALLEAHLSSAEDRLVEALDAD
ncbi:GntR family transcriptional regulator [Microbacterium oxydans]|jgi:DNA-binding GntR family transcriptional regulator|uniref:GntR family transcriptional regulator n=1 Tax=Microbacterium TaxID=33882 RepID=UPI0007344E15|nr:MULTISPECIES: GntR family transcriptional regulator [Microbacterium]KAB1890897.1 GntR family transcriptional regulator [Microbacterium oxydans]KTR79015.1 GntR family transcriptional regulator [Microbacterium oxydans]MBE7954336.1 GntR family transcriptional regulator [Microbacterium sp. R1]MCB8044666.1 GntR family transcriptional regulator [Microbacterium oxydans]NYF28044.1 DNA-binding GntR family transcriptional regulator [Microbacterium sp. JAI119]